MAEESIKNLMETWSNLHKEVEATLMSLQTSSASEDSDRLAEMIEPVAIDIEEDFQKDRRSSTTASIPELDGAEELKKLNTSFGRNKMNESMERRMTVHELPQFLVNTPKSCGDVFRRKSTGQISIMSPVMKLSCVNSPNVSASLPRTPIPLARPDSLVMWDSHDHPSTGSCRKRGITTDSNSPPNSPSQSIISPYEIDELFARLQIEPPEFLLEDCGNNPWSCELQLGFIAAFKAVDNFKPHLRRCPDPASPKRIPATLKVEEILQPFCEISDEFDNANDIPESVLDLLQDKITTANSLFAYANDVNSGCKASDKLFNRRVETRCQTMKKFFNKADAKVTHALHKATFLNQDFDVHGLASDFGQLLRTFDEVLETVDRAAITGSEQDSSG